MLLAELWPFALLALAASLHCMGMCGGFVVALTHGGRDLAPATWFSLGKAATYTLLGLALALVATPARDRVHEVGPVLAWVAGGALVLLGLVRLGLPWPTGPARLFQRAAAPVRRVYGQVARLPGYAGPLGAGLLAGTLPCGVTWGALALAVTRPPLEAALGMAVFGLATSPSLMATAFGWTRLRAHLRGPWLRLAGPLLIALGLWTGLRGGLPGGAEQAVLPPCCAEGLQGS